MNKNNQDVSKTLSQVILDGIKQAQGQHPVESIRVHLQDYLAQRFAVAMLQAKDTEETQKFEDLFVKITGKEKKVA